MVITFLILGKLIGAGLAAALLIGAGAGIEMSIINKLSTGLLLINVRVLNVRITASNTTKKYRELFSASFTKLVSFFTQSKKNSRFTSFFIYHIFFFIIIKFSKSIAKTYARARSFINTFFHFFNFNKRFVFYLSIRNKKKEVQVIIVSRIIAYVKNK